MILLETIRDLKKLGVDCYFEKEDMHSISPDGELCLDTLAMVLNDPEVMGRDTFGAKRLMRICEAFNKKYETTKLALRSSDDADYIRAKIDQEQARIFGPEYLHWQERYPYWDENDTY